MIFYLVPHFAVLGDSKEAKYRHQVYVSNIEIILLCQSLCARQQKQDPPIRLVQIIFDSLGKYNDLYQGGRSCAGARGAPAEKFGLG